MVLLNQTHWHKEDMYELKLHSTQSSYNKMLWLELNQLQAYHTHGSIKGTLKGVPFYDVVVRACNCIIKEKKTFTLKIYQWQRLYEVTYQIEIGRAHV